MKSDYSRESGNLMSTDESSTDLQKWHPNSSVCLITNDLIAHQSGETDFRRIYVLDLHLRDGSLGKIRKIENLESLINIQQLNVSYNAITRIEGLDSLVTLVELNLAENSITKIENLFSLRLLERLSLCGNDIERIPVDIAQLRALTVLRLNRNKLSVQKDLEHLSPLGNLRELRIDSNPISSGETRRYAIHVIPLLRVLDNETITAADRAAARDAHMPSELNKLKQRLLAEQRRAEILDAEAHEIKKQHQQLSMRSPGKSQVGRDGTGDAANKLELLSRLRIEKTNEATEAKYMVSQLQQELTYKSIDANFDRWGEDANSSSSAESSRAPPVTSHHPDDSRHFTSQSRAAPPEKDRINHERNRHRRHAAAASDESESDTRDRRREVTDNRIGDTHAPPLAQRDDLATLDEANSHIRNLSNRVERLGAKLLQSEKEKSEASSQLHEMEERLREREGELEAVERALQLAQDEIKQLKRIRAAGDAASQTSIELEEARSRINALTKEVNTLREEEKGRLTAAADIRELRYSVEEKVHAIARLENDVDYHKTESSRWKSELEKTVASLKGVREDLLALERKNHALELEKASWETTSGSRGLAAETSGLLQLRDSMEMEHSQRTIDQLRRDLEEARMRATSSRDAINKSNEENATLRESVRQKDQEVTSLRDQVHALESTARKADGGRAKTEELLDAERSARERVERELVSTRRQLADAQADLEAYMGTLNAKPSEVFHNKGQTNIAASTGYEQRGTGMGAGGYFDETESTIDTAEPFLLSSPRRDRDRDRDRGDQHAGRSHSPPPAMPVGRLERAAAEAIAAVIMEEFVRGGYTTSDKQRISQEAAVRASLRLVYSASRISHEKGYGEGGADGISPLQALGDKRVLAEMVAQAQAGLQAIQEARAARAEVIQQQRVLDDLSAEEKKLTNNLSDKDLLLKSLVDHCDEAKKEAEVTLSQLSDLVEQLREGQRTIQTQESKLTTLRKEIDDARVEFAELNNLSQLEHKNITSTRNRLAELHKDCSEWETRVAAMKDKFTNEDMRYRNAKSLGTDQIRLLQSDLLKLEADLKAKKRALDETDKLRKALEVEADSRQRDINQQLLVLARDLEDATRNLSSAQGAVRTARLELEQVQSQKKHVEEELQLLEDKRVGEARRMSTEIEDGVRRKKELDVKIASAEKRHRAVKDKVTSLEAERDLLAHAVEDLQRNKGEIDRVFKERQRAMEDELAATHQQTQVAARAARQSLSDAEQKRAECDAIEGECRIAERRYEELRRLAKEQESEVERLQGTAKALQSEHSKWTKEIYTLKRDEEELKMRLQMLRSNTDGEDREAEDVRRRLTLLRDEEADLKDREGKLKTAWAQMKKSLDDCQSELQEARAASERERRALSDIRSKKVMMEADIARCEEELRFAQDQMEEEDKRRMVLQVETQKSREELAQIQRETMAAQRRHNEALRVESEWKRREGDAVQIQNRLRMEMESLGTAVTAERHKLDALSKDRAAVMKETKSTQEELSSAQRELASVKVSLESAMAQQMHVQSVKEELQLQISRLREAEKVELLRAERVNESYKDLERRLKEVRAELSREEGSYARVKSRSIEEESKLAERHRSLYSATEELSKIEGIMSDLHSNIHEERGKAIEEISRLGQVKQSVQSQMFMLSEAQRRSDRMAGVLSHPVATTYGSDFTNVSSGGNKVSYMSPISSGEEGGIPRSRHGQFKSAMPTSAERVTWAASDGHGSSTSKWGSEGGVTSISHSFSRPAPDFSHEHKSDTGSGEEAVEVASGYDRFRVEERNHQDEYSTGGLHSEISDLRAEMQKLSAQSAAVLRDAETAGGAAKSRGASTFS